MTKAFTDVEHVRFSRLAISGYVAQGFQGHHLLYLVSKRVVCDFRVCKVELCRTCMETAVVPCFPNCSAAKVKDSGT